MLIDLLEKSSDTVGVIGVILVLIAFFLLSTNKMNSQSLSYQLYNLIGASLILFSLMFHFNLASVLIEVSWITISLIGIFRIRSTKKKQINKPDNLYSIVDAKVKSKVSDNWPA